MKNSKRQKQIRKAQLVKAAKKVAANYFARENMIANLKSIYTDTTCNLT